MSRNRPKIPSKYGWFGVVAAGALALSGCGSAQGPASGTAGNSRSGSEVIELAPSGSIGRLQIDQSTNAEIRSAVGEPALVRTGHVVSGYPSYLALGFSCSVKSETVANSFRIGSGHYVVCGTVFYVNQETKRLAGLVTTSHAFRLSDGIKVGMSVRRAERLAHQRAVSGCLQGFQVPATAGGDPIWVDVAGGSDVIREHNGVSLLEVRGGYVDSLTQNSGNHSVGLTFC